MLVYKAAGKLLKGFNRYTGQNIRQVETELCQAQDQAKEGS